MDTYVVGEFEPPHVSDVLPQCVFAIHLPREEKCQHEQRCPHPYIGTEAAAALRHFPAKV